MIAMIASCYLYIYLYIYVYLFVCIYISIYVSIHTSARSKMSNNNNNYNNNNNNSSNNYNDSDNSNMVIIWAGMCRPIYKQQHPLLDSAGYSHYVVPTKVNLCIHTNIYIYIYSIYYCVLSCVLHKCIKRGTQPLRRADRGVICICMLFYVYVIV